MVSLFKKEWTPSNGKTKGVVMKCKVVLLVAVLFSVISMNVFAYSGGSGTEVDPYLISNKADLIELGATSGDYDKYFRMTADIDLDGESFTNAIIAPDLINSNSWTFDGPKFTGTFDGDGHIVKNLTINGDLGSQGSDSVGLFGYVDGNITSLGVVYCNITGDYNVGGICGWHNTGVMTNCYSSGVIDGGEYVGGLCGDSGGSYSDCYTTCAVNGYTYVGGFSGYNWGTINDCYSVGSVSTYTSYSGATIYSGGFCGYNDGGSINNCFWDTNVSGMTTSDGGAGKTTVEMQTLSTFTAWDFTDTWSMNNCYPKLNWQALPMYHKLSVIDGSTSGLYLHNNVVNIVVDPVPSNYSFAGWTTTSTIYTNLIASLLSLNTTITMPDSYVELVANYAYNYSGGAGTVNNPYLIASKSDLLILGSRTIDYGKSFKMTADIDLSGTNFSKAIIAPDILNGNSWTFDGTRFAGSFDGDGHVVKNLTINGDVGSVTNDCVGLFGSVVGTIKSLGLVDCSIIGHDLVGGICGSLYVDGIISNCYSIGVISGESEVGGLCGHTDRCFVTRCYSSVTAIRGDYVGGLIGYSSSGTITECYSTGDVSGSSCVGGFCGYNASGTITECYSTGDVSGSSPVGGFCGYSAGGVGAACFWDTETSGLTSSGGGTGKTTEEMKTQSTFTDAGWDFTETWKMDGYPKLQWQKAYGTLFIL